MRERLSEELTEVINLYGPQLYEDFDQYRMLAPSAQVPPSASAKPGLFRRKSGPGMVDGQESLLVHPMTWLDEVCQIRDAVADPTDCPSAPVWLESQRTPRH